MLTQTVVISLLRPRDSFLLPGLRGAGAVLRYGIEFATSRLLESFTRNAHEFIIAKQSGFAAVGLFSRALGVIDQDDFAIGIRLGQDAAEGPAPP